MSSSLRTPDRTEAANDRRSGASILLVVSGLVYPFAVYFGLGVVPPSAFVVVALLLFGARIVAARALAEGRELMGGLIAAACLLAALALVDQAFAAKAYPILMSLVFAGLFGISLLRPPSLIERIVRLRGETPSTEAGAYMRNVTKTWLAFLLLNAAISLATALSDDLALWTFYNGLVSYLLMGLLFGVEYLVRRHLQRRAVS